MKLRSLAVCALATALFASAADPRLRFEPTEPHPGQTITITFDPAGGPLEKSESLTLVYGPTPNQWMRAPMQRKGNRFVAEVRAWVGTAYLWCWVEDQSSGEKDTNRGTAWDTYLYDDHGLPVKGARQLRAGLYQLRGQPIDKNTASLTLLEEELRAFPSNGFARGEWWGLRFEDAGHTDDVRSQLMREIAAFLDSNNGKPWAYEAAANGYHRIGRTPLAVDTMRAFVKRFPQDDSLDGTVNFYFQISGSISDLEGLQKASPRWAASPFYWESLFQANLSPSAIEPARLKRTGESWIASFDKSDVNNPRVRIRVAESWLANAVDAAAAERIAREAVNLSEFEGKFLKNSSLNPGLSQQTVISRIHRSTLGWALFQQKRYEEALTELERAVAIGQKEQLAMRDVYYRLGRTLELLNRPEVALDAYIQEFASGGDNVLAFEAAGEVYSKIHGGREGFSAEVKSRVNDLAMNAATADTAVQEMNEKPGRFDLRTPDGKPVLLSRYEGKAVIVDFWGTWCGPCLASLENTEKLERQFPGKIAVLAVSTDWEETRPHAQPYLTEKNYDFLLLFDDQHLRDLEIPFVPTRFLIDQTGRLRLRQTGTGPYADLIFEQKLRALLNESHQ
jgi:thiol-disulfide isomerase/thioredoxin